MNESNTNQITHSNCRFNHRQATRLKPKAGINFPLFTVLLSAALAIAGTTATATAKCLTPSFGPPNIFPAGDGPQAAVAGDFDEDGIPDLAVAHENSFDIYIFLGGVTNP